MKKSSKPRSCLNNRAERRGVTESVIQMLGTDTPGHVRQQMVRMWLAFLLKDLPEQKATQCK